MTAFHPENYVYDLDQRTQDNPRLHTKIERLPSPDHIFRQFSFRYPHSVSQSDQSSPDASTPGSASQFCSPTFSIGTDSMSNQHWQLNPQNVIMQPHLAPAAVFDLRQTLSLDELDDYGDSGDAAATNLAGSTSGFLDSQEKQVKRRSSKACDQCRKSKCKCERNAPGEPCKNCMVLSTPCTFLGPSRKRGPPKGYIDALEARLHQTEALLGVLLICSDSGNVTAKGFIDTIKQDALAAQIIARIDSSSYGPSGRRVRGSNGVTAEKYHHSSSGTEEIHISHPSNEWQDQVTSLVVGLTPSMTETGAGEDNEAYRRQRRRLDQVTVKRASTSPPIGSPSSHATPSSGESSEEEDLADAVGQLSLNEDAQVRYHGKASGLHLLGTGERVDDRNEGGIWRFPKARVWPPLPPTLKSVDAKTDGGASSLPEQATQDHLIELYFSYVHPSLPVIHKRAFFASFRDDSQPESPAADESFKAYSPFSQRRRPIRTLLLLTMYSLAARYSSEPYSPPAPADSRAMWAAGDEYLDAAKILLDRAYAGSCPQTCQALLLLGYREIGIGAMAQAWTYIGMAVRMAQDLGMHRSADGWARAQLGGRLFGEWELHERKRIWYACVIMDKYVSSYIGRPPSIYERDFDTPIPDVTDPEEDELWEPHPSAPIEEDQWQWVKKRFLARAPVPGRIISCFNASASLSSLLGQIIEALYSVRPLPKWSRHAEAARLEALLDKWYLELPEHLRYEPGSNKSPALPPHILTLHMQYWCAVILLHRPFIRQHLDSKSKHHGSDKSDDGEGRALAEKSYELCAAAANHITSIVGVYVENFCLKRCAVFLCYYVFTASIMHVTTLMSYPTDPQARTGFKQCKEALRNMDIVWPSAGRAFELLIGSKVNVDEEEELAKLPHNSRHQKRPLEDDDTPVGYPNFEYFTEGVPTTPSEYAGTHPAFITPGGTNLVTADSNFAAFRWPSGADVEPPPLQLSTSVLPQSYSTGLGGRVQIGNGRPYSTTGSQNQNQRYPQFWNDYSMYSQLGDAYGSIPRQQLMDGQSGIDYQVPYNLYSG